MKAPRARRFQTDIGPFAAAVDHSKEAVAWLTAIIPDGGDISLLEPSPPSAPTSVEVSFTAPGVQMVTRVFTRGASKDLPIEPLGDADAEEMLALALLTRPGPFRARTHTLGRFIGIRDKANSSPWPESVCRRTSSSKSAACVRIPIIAAVG